MGRKFFNGNPYHKRGIREYRSVNKDGMKLLEGIIKNNHAIHALDNNRVLPRGGWLDDK